MALPNSPRSHSAKPKPYALAAMVLLAFYLLYRGHFVERTNFHAGLCYGAAMFLVYAASRRYFDLPVFETAGGKMLAVASPLLYLGFDTSYPNNATMMWAFGLILAGAGLSVYGMEVKEKELRERARRLGLEELMFPKR
jgi:hypothetical protein